MTVRRLRRWPLAGSVPFFSPFVAVIAALVALPTAVGSESRGDFASRISSGDSASEYWDIAAQFDSGHSLFARFLITNEGPGERTAIANWYLVDPDGSLLPFRNGRRQARWKLSAEGSRIEIGSSLFDQSGPIHLLEYHSGKRKIRIDLRFSPEGPVASTNAAGSGDYSVDLLDLGAPVTGTLWHGEMAEPLEVSGTIAVTHTWMELSESDLALRRIEFSTEGEGPSIYLLDLTTPRGDRHSWLVVERDGEVIVRTKDFQLELTDQRPSGVEGYPVPGTLRIRAAGIEGTIDPGPVLLRANPLEDIPQPFRFLLSFKMRPHRVWARASYEVELKATKDLPAMELKGSGVATFTFLNPLPPDHT